MRVRWSLLPALGATAVIATTALPAAAQEITYTESATLSGYFDDVAFTDDSVVFTLTGDTSDIVNSGGGHYTLAGTVTVSFDGGPAYTLTDATSVFAETGEAGFYDDGVGEDILADLNAAFGDYDLSTAIGPIASTTTAIGGHSVSTSGGDLLLSDIEGNATFTATVDSVPEPGSLALLASALAGGTLLRRRRRRAS